MGTPSPPPRTADRRWTAATLNSRPVLILNSGHKETTHGAPATRRRFLAGRAVSLRLPLPVRAKALAVEDSIMPPGTRTRLRGRVRRDPGGADGGGRVVAVVVGDARRSVVDARDVATTIPGGVRRRSRADGGVRRGRAGRARHAPRLPYRALRRGDRPLDARVESDHGDGMCRARRQAEGRRRPSYLTITLCAKSTSLRAWRNALFRLVAVTDISPYCASFLRPSSRRSARTASCEPATRSRISAASL
jgi:hypothetical protein